MKSQPHDHTTANPYEGVALLADPLYRYIQFTVPGRGKEREQTEKDLIDSPWMQRLRMRARSAPTPPVRAMRITVVPAPSRLPTSIKR